MSLEEIWTFASKVPLLLGAYLLINGFIGIFRFKSSEANGFFSLASVCLAIVFLTNEVTGASGLGGISMLLTWSFFYLFVSSNFSNDHTTSQAYVFIIPLIWFTIQMIDPQGYQLVFHTLYFLHLITLVAAGLYKSYLLHRLRLKHESIRSFFRWLYYGLLLVLTTRFLLPFLIADVQSYMRVFHLIAGIYFVGVSHFYLRPIQPAKVDKSPTDHASNYVDEVKRRLETAMKREKAYLIPDLTIQELASKMQMNSKDLSGFFNSNLGKNFNDVINEYRIEEVKRLITDPTTDPNATIMELAYRSGFNSKATFNRLFKRLTGSTPKDYKKTNKQGS